MALTLRVPGKVFLMGEYGVIQGGDAIVLATRPPFEFLLQAESTDAFHPESPVAQFFRRVGCSANLKLMDKGLGAGFGGSTAELIAGAHAVLGALPPLDSFWKEYRDAHPLASGADLAVQLEATRSRDACFYLSKHHIQAVLPKSGLFNQTLLFSVPGARKLATHEALKVKANISIEASNEYVQKMRQIFTAKEEQSMQVLSEFSEFIHRAGLETPFAHQVRLSFQSIAGVIGVKGCGAGLNDVFLVAIEASRFETVSESVITVAREQGLHFLGKVSEHLW